MILDTEKIHELEDAESKYLTKEECFIKELLVPKSLYSRLVMWDFADKYEDELKSYTQLLIV